MSLVMIEGFDNVRNYNDMLTKTGWVQGTVTEPTLSVPSRSGVPGMAWVAMSSYMNGSNASVRADNIAPGGGNLSNPQQSDILTYDTGVTANQAWTAGGFGFGASASFLPFGTAPSGGRNNEIVYDDVNKVYLRISATNTLDVSTDSNTWTTPTVQPAGLVGVSKIFYVGGGVTVIPLAPSVTQTTLTALYSTNGGQSWTSSGTMYTTAGYTYYTFVGATGNSTYPHIVIGNASGSNTSFVLVGNFLTNSWTTAYTSSAVSSNTSTIPRVYGNYVVASNGNYIFSCPVASIQTSSSWTAYAVTGNANVIVDLQFFPGGNCWVFAVGNGAYSLPNPGTSVNPLPPTAVTYQTNTYVGITTTAPIMNMVMVSADGTKCTVAGYSTTTGGAMFSTTNGTTWTSTDTAFGVTNGNLFGNLTATNYLSLQFWSPFRGPSGSWGLMYTIGGSLNIGYAASPDGTNGWTSTHNYMAAYGSASGSNVLQNGLGVTTAPGPLVSNVAYTPGAGQAIFNCSTAPSSASTAITVYTATVRGSTPTSSTPIVTGATGQHYYEVLATKDPANVNQFFISFYIDGALAYGPSSTSVAFGTGTSDTTSHLIVTFPRCTFLNTFDDMYMTLQDGIGTVGPLGMVNVQTFNPTSDAQKQWTPGGVTQSTNAATVSATSVTQAQGYVTSNTAGNKDEYGNSSAIGAVYGILGVKVEAFAQKAGLLPGQVSVGVLSGASEVDSATASITSNSYVNLSKISDKDPNGNVAWTSAAVAAAKIALTQVG